MVVLSYYATEGPRIMYYTVLLFIMYVLCIMYYVYATLENTVHSNNESCCPLRYNEKL